MQELSRPHEAQKKMCEIRQYVVYVVGNQTIMLPELCTLLTTSKLTYSISVMRIQQMLCYTIEMTFKAC